MRECRLDADHVGSHTDLGILYGWRHQPQSFSTSEVRLLIVLMPGSGSFVCLLAGAVAP